MSIRAPKGCKRLGCTLVREGAVLHHRSPWGHDHFAVLGDDRARVAAWAAEVHGIMGWR